MEVQVDTAGLIGTADTTCSSSTASSSSSVLQEVAEVRLVHKWKLFWAGLNFCRTGGVQQLAS